MKRRRHHNREQTRNERAYAVRYAYPTRQGWRSADFITSDKAQAYRQARHYAQRGWLRSFSRHLGGGRWADIQLTAPSGRKGGAR
ncbi:hypothetical protein ACIHFC_29025 [Streptomyces sp. NPDC052013]|uniref:hypothetical protein n=1 Tax=Streptomyces sp. NPDC052013 TaxID=3365679 RepID=UPI0037D4A731